jgi:pimeloyl-ACP methyl ester carboxylesterase
LHESHRCIALELRGHGDSDWAETGSYPLRDYVADLERVGANLGLSAFVLVGHSLGGLISLTYAANHLDQLAGLVIVDTGPRSRQRSGTARIREFLTGLPAADSLEEFVDRALAFNPRRDRNRLRRSLTNSLRQTSDGRWTWKYDQRRVAGPPVTPEEFARTQEALRAAARTIRRPTLLIHGGDSDTYSDGDAEAFAKILPRGRLVTIAGAGHTVQGDRPHAFAEALEAFINQEVIRQG